METTLIVSGMTCQNCVKHVTHALEAVDGVSHVRVDLASGVARVQGTANPTSMVAAVEEEGYKAEVAP